MRHLFSIFLICISASLRLSAADLALTNIPPAGWRNGVTVGLLENVQLNTNRAWFVDLHADVDRHFDNTGHTNIASAWAQWITDIGAGNPSNYISYLPAGHYVTYSALNMSLPDLYVKGDGIGRTFINCPNGGVFQITAGDTANNYTVTNGATAGSTNLTVTDVTGIAVGSLCWVGSDAPVDETTHTIGVGTGHYGSGLTVWNYVTGVSGNTVTLRVPLPYSMTNQTQLSVRTVPPHSRIIFEGISFTTTNPPTAEGATSGDLGSITMARNFVFTNCSFEHFPAHNISIDGAVVGGLVTHCIFRDARGFGSGTGGIRTGANCVLWENNAFIDTPGFEVNSGWGCVWFANYFNSPLAPFFDVNMHSTHPWFMLFEANHFQNGIMNDGYYGSCSQWTIFRNFIPGYGYGYPGYGGAAGYACLKFDRWARQHNVVGNVLGNPDATWFYRISATNQSSPAIYWHGLPNLGNQLFSGVRTNDSLPHWTWPGTNYFDYTSGLISSYTPKVFTNGVGPTNILRGFDFSDIHTYANQIQVIFQTAADTNQYRSRNTNGDYVSVTVIANDSTSLTLSAGVTVQAGDTLYVAGSGGWQQISENDLPTHFIAGNYDYANHSITWTDAGTLNLPSSMLYSNGFPVWWTNQASLVNPSNATVWLPPAAHYTNWIAASSDPSTNSSAVGNLNVGRIFIRNFGGAQ